MTRLFSLLLAIALLAAPAFAARPDAPAPDAPGPYSVGNSQYEIVDPSRADRPLPLQVWYPVDPGDEGDTSAFYPLLAALGIPSPLATVDPPVSDERGRALIVFSHGSGGFNIQSINLCETLASHGFIVAAPNHTGNTTTDSSAPFLQSAADRPQDVSFVIDHMLARSATLGDAFEGRVRHKGFGVAGHSFGGYTALAMASGWTTIPADPRVSAIMPIAPASGLFTDAELQSIRRPVMLLSGTFDTTTPIVDNTTRPASLIPSPMVYRADVLTATHTHFANICDIADALINAGITPDLWAVIGAAALTQPYLETCVPPAFPLVEAQRIQNLYAVSFFRRHLLADRRYSDYLTLRYASENEPDVVFFSATSRCGIGFELAFVIVPMAAVRRRVQRRRRLGSGYSRTP